MPTLHDAPLTSHRPAVWLALAAAAGLTAAAHAEGLDWRLSGFGTAGWAQTDRPYAYQRFLSDQGSFKRDSVFGTQLDVQFNPTWSATVQATLAPSLSDDHGLAVTATWAFVSWRPDNDWLVRLGRQRIPLFLHTENRDVGQTYDLMRLPAEVYGIAPSTDVTGLSVSRTWQQPAGEWSLDAYAGADDLSVRVSSRDLGTDFLRVHTRVVGAALTLRLEDASTFRASLYRATTEKRDGTRLDARYARVDAGFPLGSYYQVSNALPGPGVETTSAIVNDVVTLGADLNLAPDWRLVGEVARNFQRRTDLGSSTVGAYLALLHRIDRVTPYVVVSHLRSLGASMRNAQALEQAAQAAIVPDLALAQRAAGDSIPVYDQTALSLGLSYALTPHSKLKGEWMRTRIGKRSAMVDSPAGGEVVSRELINTLSISYSFVF